ncbi:MAG: alpha/beta hydrolase [Spirochaetia bacterium]|nr:alpha/beta hydrolase [Spirochaetia bacterium]
MNILIEIFTETFNSFLVLLYGVVGFIYRLPESPEGDRNPVILIPGLFESPFVFLKLRRQLIKKGHPVYIPWLAYQLSRFEKNARILEQYILDNNLRDIYIIGHSAGALIGTQMGYKGRDRIKKFFAVSAPFYGTILAFLIYFLPAGRQLFKGSSFLKNNEINFKTFSNLQCLYSRFDLLIIPGFQGRLGRNDDMEYSGLGHFNIIMRNDGVRFIMEQLEREGNKEEKLMPGNKPLISKSKKRVVKSDTKETTRKKSTKMKTKNNVIKKGLTVSKKKPRVKRAKKKI